MEWRSFHKEHMQDGDLRSNVLSLEEEICEDGCFGLWWLMQQDDGSWRLKHLVADLNLDKKMFQESTINKL